MPSIQEPSTIKALAQAFASNGRNQEQAMLEVGYSKAYANSYCGKMWDNPKLIAEIVRIDAMIQAKTEYDKDESMRRKQVLLDSIKNKTESGNLDAVRTAAGLLTNMDTICGLVKQHVIEEQVEAKALTKSESESAKAITKALHLSA